MSLSALQVKVILKELYWSLLDVLLYYLVSIVYKLNPGRNGLGFLKCLCGAFMDHPWYFHETISCFVLQSFIMLFVLIVFSEEYDYAFHFVNDHNFLICNGYCECNQVVVVDL